MTGFGSGHYKDDNYLITVEIKSLNSKFFDIQIKCPRMLNSKELDLRNMLSHNLERGKINLTIEFVRESQAIPTVKINEALFGKYYENLKSLVEKAGDPGHDLAGKVLEMPDVIIPAPDFGISDEEWKVLVGVLNEATDNCNEFRLAEGAELQKKISGYIENIASGLERVKDMEGDRTTRIRERLDQNLRQIEMEALDENRLEQELIYYIEKLDITEEMVRLKTHLDYFAETVQSDRATGKKLGFISQEIGREINTIGSKSNYAPIQKEVVQMKDELEKIKEQTLNIL